MTTPCILLDIGNVIWSDDDGDAFTLANIGCALAALGRPVSDEALQFARAAAVADRSPSLWRAVVWRFTAPDRALYELVAARVKADWEAISDDQYRAFTRPFSGMPALIAALAGDGYRLVLASNNTPRALWRLQDLDLLRHFAVKEVSDTLGLAKPDTRFYLALLAAAGSPPEGTIMVGDRLDNDVAPAKRLGMRTVRVLKGWHLDQAARTPAELPDLTLAEPAELGDALRALLA